MGPLKDAVHLSVWTYLQTQQNFRTLMTSLNHPVQGSPQIRSAWNELKENGRVEGVRRSLGLQAFLQERPDIFEFVASDRGHQLVGLTARAQTVSPSEGLPPIQESAAMAFAQTGGSSPSNAPAAATEVDVDTAVEPEASVEILAAAVSAAMVSETNSEERPAKVARTEKGKGKGKLVGKSRHGAPFIWNIGYRDLVWTPEMDEKKHTEKTKENALLYALYEAVEMHGSQTVPLSQLGSDFKVAELKKDQHFKNWRLLDILKEYEDVFELTPSSTAAGGMIVSLQPGAAAALPDAESRAEHVSNEFLELPERIENPKNAIEKAQALRIELVHALTRRGGKCAIQELGQEPRVQEKKKVVHQAKKLLDWVKAFPGNFQLTPDGQNMIVDLASPNCDDLKVIEKLVGRRDEHLNYSNNSSTTGGSGAAAKSAATSGRPPGGGGARDRGERDRGERDRDGGRGRTSNNRYEMPPPPAPVVAYGYGLPPSYGPPPGYAGSFAPGYPGQPGYLPAPPQPVSAYSQQPPATSYGSGYPPPAGFQHAPPGYSTGPSPAIPAGYPPPAGGENSRYSAQAHHNCGYPASGYPLPVQRYPPSAAYPAARY